MGKQETGLLDQAIEGVERLIVRHCELVDAALRMSAQVQAAPACGRIEALEDMKEDAMDRAVRNISRLTVDLERMKRMRERDEAPCLKWEEMGKSSGFVPKDITVSKPFPRHLMERSGLLRYVAQSGRTTLVIQYDTDSGDGWMDVICDTPILKYPADMNSDT